MGEASGNNIVSYELGILFTQSHFTLLSILVVSEKQIGFEGLSVLSETTKLLLCLCFLISAAVDMIWNRRLKEVFDRVGRALMMHISVDNIAKGFTRAVIAYSTRHRYNIDCIELFVNNGLIQFTLLDPYVSVQLELCSHEVNFLRLSIVD